VLIAAGEGDAVELKASLHHPYGPLPADLAKKVELGRLTADQAVREVQKELRLAVTKTVAAFLNSSGGTLLIGVSDAGTVLGIEPDFPYLKDKQHADGWLLSLRETITVAPWPGYLVVHARVTGGQPAADCRRPLPRQGQRNLAPRRRRGALLHPRIQRQPAAPGFKPGALHPRALAHLSLPSRSHC
jgi:hypothetical protein